MKKSLAQVVEFCKGRISVCPLNSVTQCDFFKWSHDNFPDVTMLEFKRDECDTIVEGIDENNKKIFSFFVYYQPTILFIIYPCSILKY